MGVSKYYEQILDTFEHLKLEDGRYLKTFLIEAYCYNQISKTNVTCNTVEIYEKSDVITYCGVTLRSDYNERNVINEQNAPPLRKYRQEILQSLIDSIKSYFPEDNTKNFDIFLPTNIPNEESKIISYGVIEIKSICTFFKWNQNDKDCGILLNEWIVLLRSIISSPQFCNLHNDQTTIFAFWSQFLKMPSIAWTEKTKKMIKTILVLPVGSAEAERGFSILNILLNSKRTNRLTLEHVNDIMRIKINAPDEIESFAASKYAKEWVDKHHKRTNYPTGKKTKHSDLKEYEEFERKWLPTSTLF